MADVTSRIIISAEDAASAKLAAIAKSMDSVADASGRVENKIGTASKTADQWARSFDPVAKISAQINVLLAKQTSATEEFSAAMAKGTGDADAYGRAQAGIQGKLDDLRGKLDKAKKSVDDHTVSVTNNGYATRQLGIQASQAISGIATGQPVFTTLIQQGHQVYDSMLSSGQGFAFISNAAKGLFSALGGLPGLLSVGVVGALAAAAVSANNQANALANLREALRLTHDDYSTLADQVEASAKRVASSSSLTKVAAETIGQSIASSKYLGSFSNDLDALTKSAADYSRVAGVDAAAAGKLFRQAIDDPAAAAKALADQGLPAMDAAVLRTVQNLQNSGQATEATRVVLEALRKSTTGAADDASPLHKALHDLSEAFSGAKDGGKSFASELGTTINDAFVSGINIVGRMIRGLNDLRDAAKKSGYDKQIDQDIANQYGNAGQSVVPRSTGATGALGQTDPTIQPLLDAAAKQYGVDLELLARLQLAENRAPSSRDNAGNAIYPLSSTGAVGPMQVLNSTFNDLPGFSGQNINDNKTNINAGSSLFASLLQKYKDPYLAVLAYHDGETLIDHVLKGELKKDGTGYAPSAAGLAEAALVSQQAGPKAGFTGPTPTPAGAQYGPQPLYGPPPAVAAALPESVQRLLGTGSDGTQQQAAEDAANRLIEVRKAIDDLTKSGTTNGPVMDRLHALLDKAKESAYASVSPMDALTRASRDQLAPLTAQSGAARTVAEAVNAASIALRSKGQDLSDVQADQVRGDALKKLAFQFADNVAGIDRQIDAQNRLNAAYVASGAKGQADVIARTQAEASARETAIPGTAAYADQVRILTDRNLELAKSQLAIPQLQLNKGVQDQIDLVTREAGTLGEGAVARGRMLAIMQAEVQTRDQNKSLLTAEGEQYIALKAKLYDVNAAYATQKGALDELSNFVSNTFDTIGTAITQAFATGNLAALKFKDIAKSVVSAIIAEFAKLALINPLKNFLFGGNDQTLSTVGGALGSLFGGGSAASTVAGTAGVTGISAVAKLAGATNGAQTSTTGAVGSAALTVGQNLLGSGGVASSLLSFISGGEITSITALGSSLASEAVNIVSGTLLGNLPAATNLALSGAGAGVYGVATAGEVAVGAASAATGISTTAITSAVSTVASALPAIGAAISVVTDLIQGNYRGAGLVAGGALLGTAILPGIGTAIGAVVGGLVDAFLPKHPLHPFEDVELNVQGGKVVTGKSDGQLADVASLVSATQTYADGVNKYLASVGVKIVTADGNIGRIGQGITGLAQTLDPSTTFNRLDFQNDPNDTSQFGVAKGAIAGMKFDNPQALADELAKIAAFSDATEALGIKLSHVGQDISDIHIAGVSGSNADALSTFKDQSGQSISYHGDLRTALDHDLPGQSFANSAAIDTEMQKVSDFLTGTIPSLLTPIKVTQSTVMDQYNAIKNQYAVAAQQSKNYGLDNTDVLRAAMDKSLSILMEAPTRALRTTAAAMDVRFANLTGGTLGSGQAASNNLAMTQENERAQLEDQWRQTWGDSVVTNQAYIVSMQKLIAVQNLETAAAQQQSDITTKTAAAGLYSTVADVFKRAGTSSEWTGKTALFAYDLKAQEETATFRKQWTDFYGASIVNTKEYQDDMLMLDAAHAKERLAIEQQYISTSQGMQSVTDRNNAGQAITSLTDYAHGLSTSSSSPLSVQDQYQIALSQFQAVSGAAQAGDYNSIGKLQSYSDTLLGASRNLYGSGSGYAADFSKVLDALNSVASTNADTLTASYMASIAQGQTDQLVSELQALRAEVSALRIDNRQAAAAPARLAQ